MNNNIKLTCIDEPNYIKRLIRIRKYLCSSDQDVVISFFDTPNLIALLSSIGGRRWRLIVSERSAKESNFIGMRMKLIKKLYVFTDYIVTNSENAANIWRKYHPNLKSKIKVIYNGVNININENNSYIPRKSGKLNMVVAARYRPVKNILKFIEAINNLNDNEKNQISVNWYGETNFSGNIYTDVRNKIMDYNLEDVVTLNLATSDILNIMKECDIVGLFSVLEGLPNAICEAMCLAKPIIMTKVSDYKILVDDTNGFLCDSYDVNSITTAIRNAIATSNEKLISMGYYSYEKSKELFSTENIKNKYIELFDH